MFFIKKNVFFCFASLTVLTGGIRQGCTLSPQLFVMVVIIINSIVGSRMGYRDDFYVPVLFYADDGLLLAKSCGEAEDMIQMVIEVAGEWVEHK